MCRQAAAGRRSLLSINPVKSAGQLVVPSVVEGAPRRPQDWRATLPALTAPGVTLREVVVTDAPSLFTLLCCPEVSRFISPPPQSVEAFARFIEWARSERAGGHYVCFAILPDGFHHPVGLFQVRELHPGFVTAEWGVALGTAFWGSGLFAKCAPLVAAFAFDTLGVHRLEARAAVPNGRGNGALIKIGAVREGLLKRSLLCGGHYLDQFLWAIRGDDFRRRWSASGDLLH